MPIELITGLPGNAKTLYGIQSTIKRAKEENRPVYYDGIKELIEDDPRLEGTTWTKFDAAKWHEVVPSGSLIFIDEAQKIFRARNMGATPPIYVTELEEHRHKGIDFVMTTQHPRLIDPAIKVLTQTHKHMVRVSGFEMFTSGIRSRVIQTSQQAGGILRRSGGPSQRTCTASISRQMSTLSRSLFRAV
jgi:zona occludens toxin